MPTCVPRFGTVPPPSSPWFSSWALLHSGGEDCDIAAVRPLQHQCYGILHQQGAYLWLVGCGVVSR